jgi:hypothetical protein
VVAAEAMRFCDAGKAYRGFSDVAGINQMTQTFQSHARGPEMVLLA